MNELRDSGVITGGPATFSKKDRQAFANQLDSFLIRQLKIEKQIIGIIALNIFGLTDSDKLSASDYRCICNY